MPTDDDKPTATDEAKPAADKVVSAEAPAAAKAGEAATAAAAKAGEAATAAAAKAGEAATAAAAKAGEAAKAAVAAVQDKVNAAATKWLKERFGFFEDAEGTLHLPERAARGDLPLREEQFLKGFARTVAELAPVGLGEARKPEEVPDAGEAVGRFLSKMGGAVSDAVQEYLRRNALDPQHPERPVVIDGQFIKRHGVPVLSKIVQSLGSAFEDTRAGGPGAPAPAPAASELGNKEDVQVEIELPKLLKQLAEEFAPRSSKEAPAPAPAPASASPTADASEPKKNGP